MDERIKIAKIRTKPIRHEKGRTHNSGFKKCGGQWVIEQLYFNQTFVLADSLSLRIPALLKPAKRYMLW
jgi:hypothetical protein